MNLKLHVKVTDPNHSDFYLMQCWMIQTVLLNKSELDILDYLNF